MSCDVSIVILQRMTVEMLIGIDAGLEFRYT